jgi:hypothetical protein
MSVTFDQRIDLPAVNHYKVVTIRTQLDMRCVHGPPDRHPFTPQPGHHSRFVSHGKVPTDKRGDTVARWTGGIDQAVHPQPSPVGQRDLAGMPISNGDAGHNAIDPQLGTVELGVSYKVAHECSTMDPSLIAEDGHRGVVGREFDFWFEEAPSTTGFPDCRVVSPRTN